MLLKGLFGILYICCGEYFCQSGRSCENACEPERPFAPKDLLGNTCGPESSLGGGLVGMKNLWGNISEKDPFGKTCEHDRSWGKLVNMKNLLGKACEHDRSIGGKLVGKIFLWKLVNLKDILGKACKHEISF